MFRTNTFIVCLAAFALASCVSQEEYRRALADNENLRAQRDAIAEHVRSLEGENEALVDQTRALGEQVGDSEWVKEQREKLKGLLARLESDGAADLEGVSFRQGPEGVIVEVQAEILFASGKAEVRPEGRATLEKLVPMLLRESKMLRVAGHTDSDPIVHSPWRTNLRLSAERAIGVADALIGASVPSERVAIAGYGEYQPRAEGADSTAKRLNRRVEILMLDRVP